MIIVEAFIHHLNLQPHYCAKTNIKREIRKNKRLPKSTNRLIIFLLLIFSNNKNKFYQSINAYSFVAYSNLIFICLLKFIRATRNKKRLTIQYLTIHNKNYFNSIVLSISALWKHWAYPHKLGKTRDYPQRWHNALCRHFWVVYDWWTIISHVCGACICCFVIRVFWCLEKYWVKS